MDEMKSVTADDLACAREEFLAERANVVAKNAVTSNGITAAARVPEGVARNAMTFDVEVSQGDRCDQQRSGRCWMFASLNTMRYRIIKKYNLKTFELSQTSARPIPSSGTSSRRATGSSRTSWTRWTSRWTVAL